MNIIEIDISKLKNYSNNARTHSEEQLSQIMRSIQEFGFNDPIEVAQDFTILSGHARVEVAKRLGIQRLPVVKHDHLTGSKLRAYILAANKIQMNSAWDNDKLVLELEELKIDDFDLSLTGFIDSELDELLKGMDFNSRDISDQEILDKLDPKLVKCPHCDHEFDVREC